MIASVSLEALKKVKAALDHFDVDISGIAARTERSTGEVLVSAQSCISRTKSEVESIRSKVREIKDRIARIDYELPYVKGQYEQCLNQIAVLNAQIDNLQSQRAAVNSQLDASYDDQEKVALQNSLNQINSQITQLERERSGHLAQKPVLYTKMCNLENEKRQRTSELEEAERTLSFRTNKLYRMQAAYDTMERDINEYRTAVAHLEYSSARTSGRNKSAVEKCIRAIEKYINTSI